MVAKEMCNETERPWQNPWFDSEYTKAIKEIDMANISRQWPRRLSEGSLNDEAGGARNDMRKYNRQVNTCGKDSRTGEL